MDSLTGLILKHTEEGNVQALEDLKQEIGYVIEFAKRNVARTLADKERIRVNIDQAEANGRLVQHSISHAKPVQN